MNNRNSVRAAAVGALAVAVLVSACAADVRPGAAGTGPDPAGPSSSAGMGAVGDPAAAGTSNAAGDPATARTPNSAGTPSAASSLTAGSTADPASADTRAGVEGSRTGPPINKSPSPTPSAGSGPGSSSSGGARIPAGLDGLRFGSVTATGRALVPGKPLIIEFSAGRVFLNAGCNSAAGEPVFAGSTLAVRQLITTEMACGGARGGNAIMNQESWYLDWLTKGVRWKLGGTDLVLSGHGVTVTFARLGSADRTDSSAGPGSTTATGSTTASSITASSTTGSGTDPNSAGPGSSDADQPTGATTVTVVRPQPPSTGLTMSPKTQRPGDSIPVQPTR